MALETSEVTDFRSFASANGAPVRLRPMQAVLDPAGSVGAALAGAREGLGLSVDDIAMATRVRPAHLAAIEAFDLESLPSRPFTIGYVRAYARALGLDAEAVVARFKAEAPAPDADLRPPIGIDHRAAGRLGRIALVAGVVVSGVVAWNFARHAMAAPSPPASTGLHSAPQIASRHSAGPALLGEPLPAPPEATTPAPYETPGLAAAAGGSADAALAAARQAQESAAGHSLAAAPGGAPFVAAGTVYGAPAGGSGVILQAVKPTSLVIHGPDGAVYFARELATGEAWRAPAVAGLVAEVGNPPSMQVFVAGLSRGPLTDAKTPLAHLGA